VKYRFPQIRAKYIADALAHIRTTKPADDSDTAFRDWLLQTNGVGPKTASWITRNWLGSTQVAIIDIHLYRAGLITGFFDSTENVTSHYWSLERRFLNFSNAVAVNPAHLDAIIWRQMKNCGKFACRMLPTNLGKPVAGGKLQKVA
jgi:thermostable 8-oxoguanine DNA glycosylase